MVNRDGNTQTALPGENRNRLGEETSPYLLQHRNNPVHWYAWGEEAFLAARTQCKPIFLSIGYSTCYWCHVMEQDSFERQEVADVLNRDFICIKVDREERPDVDSIYMDAVVGLTGHGGWPMSVFLTPELKPFWGGTFFYRDQFLKILEALARAWREDPQSVEATASQIRDYIADIQAADSIEIAGKEFLNKSVEGYQRQYDPRYGGFGSAPKFPPSLHIRALLLAASHTKDGAVRNSIIAMVTHTLRCMAYGGLYDHLGGGFHRYSTDEKWLVPHFEKMLYDNALLTTAYLETYQVTGQTMYAEVVQETLDYVLSDMTSPEGGFYSAEDAGEVGKEGEYYVWSQRELQSILQPQELALLSRYFPISEHGNFEHGQNILTLANEIDWSERSLPDFKRITAVLRRARAQRKRPHLDDKVITAWNGLMISGFCLAFRVLGSERYLQAAQGAAEFILNQLYKDGRLLRTYCGGTAKHHGCLDDYTFFIEALINLYQADYDVRWLRIAVKLQQAQDSTLWDESDGGYFFSDAPELVVRKKEWIDNATPSSNAVAAGNVLRLHALLLEDSYRERAERIVRQVSPLIERAPWAFPSMLIALDLFLEGPTQVVVVPGENDSADGGECKRFLKDFSQRYVPRTVVAVAESTRSDTGMFPALLEGKTPTGSECTVYLCHHNVCSAPTSDFSQVFASLKNSLSEHRFD